jgi:hypothetical protein
VAEFFTNDTAKRGLQWFPCATDVLAESIVDLALVVTAAGPLYLFSKPLQDVIVKPDRDSGLALWRRYDSAAPCLAEVVFTLHRFSSYCRFSREVAFRADMTRMA